jgi:hypothetical protein
VVGQSHSILVGLFLTSSSQQQQQQQRRRRAAAAAAAASSSSSSSSKRRDGGGQRATPTHGRWLAAGASRPAETYDSFIVIGWACSVLGNKTKFWFYELCAQVPYCEIQYRTLNRKQKNSTFSRLVFSRRGTRHCLFCLKT